MNVATNSESKGFKAYFSLCSGPNLDKKRKTFRKVPFFVNMGCCLNILD